MRLTKPFTCIPLMLLIATILFGMGFTPSGRSFQVATPTATPPSPAPTQPSIPLKEGDGVIPFDQLGQADRILKGPFDSQRVRFGLPANWQLKNGAEIQLVVAPSVTSVKPVAPGGPLFPQGATLTVTYNNKVINTILLNWVGEQTVTISIPVEALTPTRLDGRQDLYLFLNAATDCDYNYNTTVAVSAKSRFILPHDLVTPKFDLARLPWPIYQENLYLPGSATIVVPSQPSAEEMQAALTVSAGFGQASYANLGISLTPENKLSDETRKSADLIFVGKAAAFASLAGAALPAPVKGEGFDVAGAAADDGVIQIAVSPWNSARSLLVVSGGSATGVVKAAQAISSQNILTAGRPDLAVVKTVNSEVVDTSVAVDRTFSSLGYGAITLNGEGVNDTEVRFYFPAGQTTTDDAYVKLNVIHSVAFDPDKSSITILLNDMSIGDAGFGSDQSGSKSTTIKIPVYALRPGINRLVIETNLIPYNHCNDYDLTRLWLTISPDSMLHIPMTLATNNMARIVDLSSFPYPLNDNPTLQNLAFVLPTGDPVSWDVAAKVAEYLGRRMTGTLAELTAFYGDNVPDTARRGKHLVFVGKASQLPMLGEIKASLPVAFQPGSDIAEENGARIVYRLPQGASLGYLELLPVPWNPAHIALAVLGTNDEGLRWAGTAITDSRSRDQLAGNFVVVNQTQLITASVRPGADSGNLSATAVPGAAAEVQPLPTQAPVRLTGLTYLSFSKGWIPPVVTGTTIIILAILLLGLRSAFHKKA